MRELADKLREARKACDEANRRVLEVRMIGDEWKLPKPAEPTADQQMREAQEREMLEQAVQRTRQEKDLQAEMAAAVKHLEAAEKTARQKELEATMTPEEQLAYEIAERIVESNAQNTTSVGEEVITRRSKLDEAAKTAKDDGNQAKSDKNAVGTVLEYGMQQSQIALDANPGWWREPKHQEPEPTNREEEAYNEAARAQTRMTLASEKSSASKREFELAQWNLTKISRHNNNMLQEDIKKLSTDLNAARKQIGNMSALPSFMKSKIENKLNETSWPDNCMEACAPTGCKVCNEEERLELEKAKQIKLETARRAAEKKIQQAEAQEAQERLYKLLGPTHPPTKYVIEGVDDVDDEIEDVIKEVIGS